ncbi:MAG: hypothetical protein GY874_20000 [Desulfobacteraceae bacterium]|nr:hypothetical protein [Desulfobacteraceae bacterium]
MACKIIFSLLEESVSGNIGDDWQYSVEANVYNPFLTGTGVIQVPEHQLTPGKAQPPPRPGQIVTIPAGTCGTKPRVKIIVNAAEVDWLFDDKGSNVIDVPMQCPGRREKPFTQDQQILVRVRESPRFFGGEAVFKAKVRLVATCE